jgi:hypothetical protein
MLVEVPHAAGAASSLTMCALAFGSVASAATRAKFVCATSALPAPCCTASAAPAASAPSAVRAAETRSNYGAARICCSNNETQTRACRCSCVAGSAEAQARRCCCRVLRDEIVKDSLQVQLRSHRTVAQRQGTAGRAYGQHLAVPGCPQYGNSPEVNCRA